jgi:hypothetical protein
MEDLNLKARTVTWNEKPVANFITQQIDRTDRWEFTTEIWVCGISTFRKNKPNTIVLRGFLVISQHTHDPVAQVDGETGKHPAYLRVQGRKRFQDKRVRRLLFRFGEARHG